MNTSLRKILDCLSSTSRQSNNDTKNDLDIFQTLTTYSMLVEYVRNEDKLESKLSSSLDRINYQVSTWRQVSTRQCQVEVQVLIFSKKKVLVNFWRWFNLTSWCQNLADINSFSYMYDTYRHHLIKSGKLLFKAKFVSNYHR